MGKYHYNNLSGKRSEVACSSVEESGIGTGGFCLFVLDRRLQSMYLRVCEISVTETVPSAAKYMALLCAHCDIIT